LVKFNLSKKRPLWLSAYLAVCCAFTPSRRTSLISFHTIWFLILQVEVRLDAIIFELQAHITRTLLQIKKMNTRRQWNCCVWRDTEYVAVSFADKCSNPIIHSRDKPTCYNTKRVQIFLLHYPVAFCLLSRRLAF